MLMFVTKRNDDIVEKSHIILLKLLVELLNSKKF